MGLLRLAPDEPRSRQALLAEAAARGDVTATAALLKELAPGIVRTAQSLLGPTHPEVDDVVQQALIGLVQALPSFRNECAVAHFAARIVTRTAFVSSRRARVRADRREDGVDVDALESAEAAEPVDAERRRRLVRQLLATLPEEQAETLALRVVLGFSLEEVAEATGVPLNTVRSRVRLAKLALKKRIEADPVIAEALEVES